MNCTRSRSSFRMSRDTFFSRWLKPSGMVSSHLRSSVISMAATSGMVLPSTRKQRASAFRRVPLQTGQVTVSSMLSITPPQLSISVRLPSPTRKRSSEPNTRRLTTSSGRASMGSYKLKLYLRAMARMMSNLRFSRTFPSGTMPPSATDLLRSGMMVSMFTSTMVPRPLQWGQ